MWKMLPAIAIYNSYTDSQVTTLKYQVGRMKVVISCTVFANLQNMAKWLDMIIQNVNMSGFTMRLEKLLRENGFVWIVLNI